MALTKVRSAIVSECKWGVAKTSQIHYGMLRPAPLRKWKSHELPITSDCSGTLECIFYTAGAPDPSGLNYSGQGNTATQYANAEHIALSQLIPGDFIICFKGNETEHVYIVTERLSNGDMNVYSHGQESDPVIKPFSSVHSYWNSVGHVVGCRTLPIHEDVKLKWTVLTGGGKVIGRTLHPAIWATRHPRAFRTYGWVRFRKDVL